MSVSHISLSTSSTRPIFEFVLPLVCAVFRSVSYVFVCKRALRFLTLLCIWRTFEMAPRLNFPPKLDVPARLLMQDQRAGNDVFISPF